jgi:hypothetical protein
MVAGSGDPGQTTLISDPGETPEAAPSDLYLVKIAP